MATRSARAFIDASKYAAETVSAITATNPSWRFTCLRTPDADAAASFYQEHFDFTLLHTYVSLSKPCAKLRPKLRPQLRPKISHDVILFSTPLSPNTDCLTVLMHGLVVVFDTM